MNILAHYHITTHRIPLVVINYLVGDTVNVHNRRTNNERLAVCANKCVIIMKSDCKLINQE